MGVARTSPRWLTLEGDFNRIDHAAFASMLVAVLLAIAAAGPALNVVAPVAGARPHAMPQITLSAGESTRSYDSRDPDSLKFTLPLLYLHRARAATERSARTLTVQLSGLVPSAGYTLSAVSLHEDVTTGAPHTTSTSIVPPAGGCTLQALCVVRWTLDPSTPSGFYHLRVIDPGGATLWENPSRPDFVALDTWDVPLGDLIVRVYYGTLFPFARGENDLANRLAPAAVTDFIADRFVPIIRETWRTQFQEWGFGAPLHPDWDADGVVEVIITPPPHALFDGAGTYTRSFYRDGRPFPERRIWWLPANNVFQAYGDLESGVKVVFAHEFFHLMQRNVQLGSGRLTDRWYNTFIESQAMAAAAIQYPDIELSREQAPGAQGLYASSANDYLVGGTGFSLRACEKQTDPCYGFALYWRFLYEQFGDPSVLRVALEEMARHHDLDILVGMPRALDAALARLDGPLGSFEESLMAFARTNYGLRLSGGRCAVTNTSACAGRYVDPDYVYAAPTLAAELGYDGSVTIYEGGIPVSYGTDQVEVALGQGGSGQRLWVALQGLESTSRFSLQVWRLADSCCKLGPFAQQPAPGRLRQRRMACGASALHPFTPEPATLLVGGGETGGVTIPPTDGSTWNRLALIITRLDPDETEDPLGAYRVSVRGADVQP